MTAAGEETHASCKVCTWLGARPLVNAGCHGHHRVWKLLQRLILHNCSLSKQWGARNAKLTANATPRGLKHRMGGCPMTDGPYLRLSTPRCHYTNISIVLEDRTSYMPLRRGHPPGQTPAPPTQNTGYKVQNQPKRRFLPRARP